MPYILYRVYSAGDQLGILQSPYNEAKRYFPIMNDRILWRLWKPTDIYLWTYGPHHTQAYDSRKFYMQTYSSTDLIKSSCDREELFTSKIKCLKGKHKNDQQKKRFRPYK